MINRPTFTDFVAECIGRNYYVAPRRRPSVEARKGLCFVSQKAYNQIKARYSDLFGIDPYSREAA